MEDETKKILIERITKLKYTYDNLCHEVDELVNFVKTIDCKEKK